MQAHRRADGAACTGLDLSEGTRARQRARRGPPESRLDFHVGSLGRGPPPPRPLHACHRAGGARLRARERCGLDELKKCRAPRPRSSTTFSAPASCRDAQGGAHRLGFDALLGHVAWRRTVDASGLELRYYENIDAHMAHAYRSWRRRRRATTSSRRTARRSRTTTERRRGRRPPRRSARTSQCSPCASAPPVSRGMIRVHR